MTEEGLRTLLARYGSEDVEDAERDEENHAQSSARDKNNNTQ